MSRLEIPLFIKAILQGYIYFRDNDDKSIIHKGFIVKYEADIAYFEQHLEVAYGVHYFFNWREDLWLYDCEELIKDPKKHELAKRSYNYGLTMKEYDLDFEHYGIVWALTKEELL